MTTARVISTNYGLTGGTLDATRHVELQRPGPDGYVDADAYMRRVETTQEQSIALAVDDLIEDAQRP